jgi:hypothetical protein
MGLSHETACYRLRIIVLLGVFSCLADVAYAEDPDLAKLFQERGTQGTLIIESLDGNTRYLL